MTSATKIAQQQFIKLIHNENLSTLEKKIKLIDQYNLQKDQISKILQKLKKQKPEDQKIQDFRLKFRAKQLGKNWDKAKLWVSEFYKNLKEGKQKRFIQKLKKLENDSLKQVVFQNNQQVKVDDRKYLNENAISSIFFILGLFHAAAKTNINILNEKRFIYENSIEKITNGKPLLGKKANGSFICILNEIFSFSFNILVHNYEEIEFLIKKRKFDFRFEIDCKEFEDIMLTIFGEINNWCRFATYWKECVFIVEFLIEHENENRFFCEKMFQCIKSFINKWETENNKIFQHNHDEPLIFYYYSKLKKYLEKPYLSSSQKIYKKYLSKIKQEHAILKNIQMELATDEDGNSPLHNSDNFLKTKALLEKGLDPFVKNGKGAVPLAFIMKKESFKDKKKIIDLLANAMAKMIEQKEDNLRLLLKNNEGQISKLEQQITNRNLKCAITHQLLKCPYTNKIKTYEKSGILESLKTSNKDPLTRKQIRIEDLDYDVEKFVEINDFLDLKLKQAKAKQKLLIQKQSV